MLERKAELLQAMGQGTRLKILTLLTQKDLCVCEIQAALGEPQPSISRHLALLRHVGLVRARRDGNRLVCGIAHPRVAALLEDVDALVGAA